ncbi:MAG: ribosome silencing factor [Bacteroidota bacterium]|nr:ribosome silencing factor [Bacteroidota bacterium]
MEAKELARHAAELTLTKKAQDVLVLDLTGLSDVTNFFVICSGESDTQVKAIADAVVDGTRERGSKVWRKEGFENLQWVLLDFVDVVVHVFTPKTRAYYDIERLWGDAPVTRVKDD